MATSISWRARAVSALALTVCLALTGGSVATAAPLPAASDLAHGPINHVETHPYRLTVLTVEVFSTGDEVACGEVADFAIVVNDQPRLAPDNGASWWHPNGIPAQEYCHQIYDMPPGLPAGTNRYSGSAQVGSDLVLSGLARELDTSPFQEVSAQGSVGIEVPPPGGHTEKALILHGGNSSGSLALAITLRLTTT